MELDVERATIQPPGSRRRRKLPPGAWRGARRAEAPGAADARMEAKVGHQVAQASEQAEQDVETGAIERRDLGVRDDGKKTPMSAAFS